MKNLEMRDKTTIDLTGESLEEIERDDTLQDVEMNLGALSVEKNAPPVFGNHAAVQYAVSSQTSIHKNVDNALDQREGYSYRERSRTLSLSPSVPSLHLSSKANRHSEIQKPVVVQAYNQAEWPDTNVPKQPLSQTSTEKTIPNILPNTSKARSHKRKRPGVSETLNFKVTKPVSQTQISWLIPPSESDGDIDIRFIDENKYIGTARGKRQRTSQQPTSYDSFRHDSSSSQAETAITLDSDNDNDDDDDDVLDVSALFSIMPVNAHYDEDIEILRTITRKANDLSTSTRRTSSIKCAQYHCAAGKCVELRDHSFLIITDIIEDDGKTWVVGRHFMRHNDFEDIIDGELTNDTKRPRRHNEVVLMTTIKNGLSTDLVTRRLDEVLKNRCLIFTNQTFPAMSSVSHPDAWPQIEQDKTDGPLFCRWRQTHVLDNKNNVIEQSIERISAKQATDSEHMPDSIVRLKWRNRPTISGGSHECWITQVTEDDHCMEESQQYTFGDTFCGAGGASCGASQAGLCVKFGVDMNKVAIDTYRLNNKGAECIVQSIDKFIERAAEHDYGVDVLHLSPPCQPFSPAHTIPNVINDEKNQAVMFAVGELLDKLKPRVATVEETYGLLNRHKEWFNALIKMFVDRGFSIRWTGARLEEHGLPQKRQRLLIVAAAPGEALPEFPKITHSAKDLSLKPLVTIHDTISHIPARSTILNHDLDFARYEPHQYKQPYSPQTQAKTITTSGGVGNWHPSGKRQFTIRELAALQRFPSTYKFADTTITNLRRQIGNAVPPYVFKKLYREIIKSLKKTDGVLV